MVPPLVAVALDHYRDPTAFEHLRDPSLALPEGFPRMLADFSAALASGRIEDTAAQLSVEPPELEDAARFLIRHLLLDAPNDYYRCLGITRDAPPDLIRTHYLLLNRLLHPDRLPDPTEIDLQYARRLNQAYQILNDPEARSEHDRDAAARTRDHRPSDPRVFFRRRHAIAQQNASAEPLPAASASRGVLRFVVPGILLVGGAAVLVLILLPLQDQHSAYSMSSAAYGNGARVDDIAVNAAAERAPAPAAMGVLAAPGSADEPQSTPVGTASAGQARLPAAAHLVGDATSPAASGGQRDSNRSAFPQTFGSSSTPWPAAGHQPRPESLPVARGDRHGEDAPSPSASAARSRSQDRPASPPRGTDRVPAGVPNLGVREADTVPTGDRTFPFFEFPPPQRLPLHSQPPSLNP